MNFFNHSCSEGKNPLGFQSQRPQSHGFSWDFSAEGINSRIFSNINILGLEVWQPQEGKLFPVCPFQLFWWCWSTKMMSMEKGLGRRRSLSSSSPISLSDHLGMAMAASQNPTPEEEQSCSVGLGLLRERDNGDQMLGFDFGDDWQQSC